MRNRLADVPDSDLDEVIAQIQSMGDVRAHLSAAAVATLSDSPNDEVHRSWFVQLAERVMRHAVSIGLIQAFRVQCDRENNPDALAGTSCFRANVFYRKPGAQWCCIELILGEGEWFVIDSGEIADCSTARYS